MEVDEPIQQEPYILPEHDDSSDEESLDGEEVEEDYNTIFEKLKKDWLLAENKNLVSKTASETFWKIGLKYFSKLQTAPGWKRTPQFKTIRKHMYDEKVPTDNLEIAYKEKSSGQVVIVKDTITPMKNYSPANYEKMYEIGTIKVSSI